jgi:hypothetical protein
LDHEKTALVSRGGFLRLFQHVVPVVAAYLLFMDLVVLLLSAKILFAEPPDRTDNRWRTFIVIVKIKRKNH